MVRGGFLVLALLGGCAYISKHEFDVAFDADGDGWGIEEDCAPEVKTIFPGAPDLRGDGCDADCGVEADADGDDWPDDSDCAPNDPTIYPCAPDGIGDHIDSDCDGADGPRAFACNDEPPWVTDGTKATRFGEACPNPVQAPS